MRYFNEHRRKITRGYAIRGIRRSAFSGGEEASLKNCSGIAPERIEIIGNTEQKQYTGKNLFDISKITGLCNTSGSAVGSVISGVTVYERKGDVIIIEVGVYYGFRGLYNSTMHLEPGTYSVSFDAQCNAEKLSSLAIYSSIVSIDKTIDDPRPHSTLTKIDIDKTVTLGYDFTVSTEGDYFIAIQGGGNISNHMQLALELSNIMVRKADTTSEYEPYVGEEPSPSSDYPQEICGVNASIKCNDVVYESGIELHKIDGFADTLVIDRVGSVIKKSEKIELKRVKDLLVGRVAELRVSDMGSVVCVSGVCKSKEGTGAYCTHFKKFNGNFGNAAFELLTNGYSSDLYFYGVKQNSIEDFIAWLDENDVMIAYVLDEPRSTVVDAPQLLKIETPYGKDCTVEVASPIKSTGLEVIYYSLEGEV